MTFRTLRSLHKLLATCHTRDNGNSGCNSLEVMRPYKLIAVSGTKFWNQGCWKSDLINADN